MNITGIGTDIIEIERIRNAYSRHNTRFLERLFTEKERIYCLKHNDPLPHIAGRFAAKEAIVKAMGTGFQDEISWTEIEVLNDPLGKPVVYLSADLRSRFEGAQFILSISHCQSYATATALMIT